MPAGILVLYSLQPNLLRFATTRDNRQTDEDLGGLCIRVAVIELGDIAPTQRAAKLFKTAGAFRHGDADYRLPLLANLRTLGDVAQTIEIGIGAAVTTWFALMFVVAQYLI